MHRIDNATAIPALPAPPPIGTPGFFTNGNRPQGLVPTRVDDNWLNTVQEEIANVVLAAGMQLSKTSNTQLYEAIQAIAYGANPDLSAYLPLSGGTLANPGHLVVGGYLTASLGMMAIGGIRYLQGSNHHSFSWDGSTVHSYVDGLDLGSLVTSDYPGAITIRGGIAISAGGLVVGGGGNFTGDIGAANIIAASSIYGTYFNSSGDAYIAGTHTAGTISAVGNVNGTDGVFAGDISANAFYGAYLSSTGAAFVVGNLTAGSLNTGPINCGDLFGSNLSGFNVNADAGLFVSPGGQLLVNQGGAQGYQSVTITGNVHITGNGDSGLNLQNASAHFGRAVGIGTGPHGNAGSCNVADTYYRNLNPIMMIDQDMEDAIRAAPNDTMFLVRKVGTDRVEAVQVEAGSAAEADARGRRPLYLVLDGSGAALPS